ncbi:hypothetical protein AcV5_003295 [Taiwanofungus camphoratus]|nr:hypothetical protein AcV5_003295 [Antrodia cinnamomea]
MTHEPSYHSYPIPNSVLIENLGLIKHPEGGYYAETDRQPEQIPSPFAGKRTPSLSSSHSHTDRPSLTFPGAKDNALRSLATTIYYLLTPDRPNGVFHMNKSATMHVLHQGRAEYTLITPGRPPHVEKKIMGSDIHAGEVLQLLVPSGVWKMSRLLPADLARSGGPARTGCLITEVVFPGFAWQDHRFLTRAGLEALWADAPGAEEWFAFVES